MLKGVQPVAMFGKICSCYYKIVSSNILNELQIDIWRIQVYISETLHK